MIPNLRPYDLHGDLRSIKEIQLDGYGFIVGYTLNATLHSMAALCKQAVLLLYNVSAFGLMFQGEATQDLARCPPLERQARVHDHHGHGNVHRRLLVDHPEDPNCRPPPPPPPPPS